MTQAVQFDFSHFAVIMGMCEWMIMTGLSDSGEVGERLRRGGGRVKLSYDIPNPTSQREGRESERIRGS